LIFRCQIGEKFTGRSEVFAFEMDEAYDDVGYLNAGVVDVVLDTDLVAALVGVWTKETLEGIAENGVAEMADVRGFVGVDAGVLDQAEAGATDIGVLIGGDSAHGSSAIEADVEVSGSGDFYAGNALEIGKNSGEFGCELCCDDARSLAKALGQLEGDREGELAESDAGRLLNRELREGDVVLREKNGLNVGQERLLNCAIHAWSSPLGKSLGLS
jgi:hypothetical protein